PRYWSSYPNQRYFSLLSFHESAPAAEPTSNVASNVAAHPAAKAVLIWRSLKGNRSTVLLIARKDGHDVAKARRRTPGRAHSGLTLAAVMIGSHLAISALW